MPDGQLGKAQAWVKPLEVGRNSRRVLVLEEEAWLDAGDGIDMGDDATEELGLDS